MSNLNKQIFWSTLIILLAIIIHHWMMCCKINCTCESPGDPGQPLLPDCVKEIDSESASVYIDNFSAWLDTSIQTGILAFNTSACLDSALYLQITNPKADQDGMRVYYGLTKSGIPQGDSTAGSFMKFIIIPKNKAGENLPNSYYMADPDEFSWRPCPPYCDR